MNLLDQSQKKYSMLVDNNEHKKVKGVNKNVVAMMGHNGIKVYY